MAVIQNQKVLGIIPARGGSKGVLGKNIRDLGGKPLLAWTIEEARKSKYLDRTVLSSEDSEIIKVAKKWNCEVPFVRPASLALDDTPGIEPVLHALEHLSGYDWVVLLQPTSPLRTVEDIDGAIEYCISQKSNSCISLSEAQTSPYWMYKLDSNRHMIPLFKEKFARRQDLPKIYGVNGAVYVSKISWLVQGRSFVDNETLGYLMPRERSLDLDTDFDLQLISALLAQRSMPSTSSSLS